MEGGAPLFAGHGEIECADPVGTKKVLEEGHLLATHEAAVFKCPPLSRRCVQEALTQAQRRRVSENWSLQLIPQNLLVDRIQRITDPAS